MSLSNTQNACYKTVYHYSKFFFHKCSNINRLLLNLLKYNYLIIKQ